MAALTANAGDKVIQDFEPDNGTVGDYARDIWQSTLDVENEKVHNGSQAQKFQTSQNGGTVSVKVAGEQGHVDLSKAKKITMWVYDTQGNNTVELRLRDANGNGGSGPDGKTLWSSKEAQRGTWTKIEWDLSSYPRAEGLDLSKISTLELFEFNPGTYYIDDIEYE